jgi:hypothetical protein
MLIFKKRFVRLGEIWLDQEPAESPVDVIQYRQRSMPIPRARCEEVHTMLVDLTKDAHALLAAMNQTTRHQIKHAAEKDNLSYEYCEEHTPSLISELCDFYDHFAVQKGLPMSNPKQVQQYADCGALGLSRMKTRDGETLVWHSYYRCPDRVRGWYTVSHFRDSDDIERRRLIGRANRYHIWCDMLKFKADGVSAFDFGGWYTGSQDEARLRINEFKRGFGGDLVTEYNCECGVTLKGKLYLRLRSSEMLQHARELYRSAPRGYDPR